MSMDESPLANHLYDLGDNGGSGFRKRLYRVVQLHVHEWRVTGIAAPLGHDPYANVTCKCGETREVPNQLPIEVPE